MFIALLNKGSFSQYTNIVLLKFDLDIFNILAHLTHCLLEPVHPLVRRDVITTCIVLQNKMTEKNHIYASCCFRNCVYNLSCFIIVLSICVYYVLCLLRTVFITYCVYCNTCSLLVCHDTVLNHVCV